MEIEAEIKPKNATLCRQGFFSCGKGPADGISSLEFGNIKDQSNTSDRRPIKHHRIKGQLNTSDKRPINHPRIKDQSPR
jgi:hypothetical protein